MRRVRCCAEINLPFSCDPAPGLHSSFQMGCNLARLSSSHKWLQGCPQGKATLQFLWSSPHRRPREAAGFCCMFLPPSSGYYFWDVPPFILAPHDVPRPTLLPK